MTKKRSSEFLRDKMVVQKCFGQMCSDEFFLKHALVITLIIHWHNIIRHFFLPLVIQSVCPTLASFRQSSLPYSFFPSVRVSFRKGPTPFASILFPSFPLSILSHALSSVPPYLLPSVLTSILVSIKVLPCVLPYFLPCLFPCPFFPSFSLASVRL